MNSFEIHQAFWCRDDGLDMDSESIHFETRSSYLLTSTSAEVKKTKIYTSTPLYAFMA
jgi:hypothetical protein